MEFIDCPQCGTRIALEEDRHLHSDVPPSMTWGEQIFTALVILFAIFLVMSMGAMYLVTIRATDDPSVLYYAIFLFGIAAVVLGWTVAINLSRNTLSAIPTMVQCFMLLLMIYSIPLAIWGYVLLRHRKDSAELAPSLDS